MNDYGDSDRAAQRRRVVVLICVCVVLAAAIGYNFYFAQQNKVTPVKRTAADFIVTWRCLACQHEEDGRAEAGVRTCPKCGKEELYVCIRHSCPRHGAFPVAFQYDENFEPIKLKIGDGDWVPYADEDFNINSHCPKCGTIMMPAEMPRPAPKDSESTPN